MSAQGSTPASGGALPDGVALTRLATKIRDADEARGQGRADRLAPVAWEVFGELAMAANGRTRAEASLSEIVGAAQAAIVIAGARRGRVRAWAGRLTGRGGAPDPLIHVAHVLRQHGWTPDPAVTAGQALAAPQGMRRSQP
jgi:hypothetical protein